MQRASTGGENSNAGLSPPAAGVGPRLTPASPCAELVPGGRSGSRHYRTHTGEWIPTPASACPGAADLGGQGQAPTCLPVPKDLSSWAPCVGRAMEQGADSSQTRSAESSPSFSWGLSNRASPLFLSHSQGPEPKPQPDLCTSWVFSCFSLLFRSPLVRLSFSSSVTFFSRKLTYNRGQRWGRIKPLRPQH